MWVGFVAVDEHHDWDALLRQVPEHAPIAGQAAGLGLGPSGAVGLHGFLSERIYWRASAGFIGAGVGTFSTDLGLGWVIGDRR